MSKGPHKPVKTAVAAWVALSNAWGPHVFARYCPERERAFFPSTRYGQMAIPSRRVFVVRGRRVVPSRITDEIGAAMGLAGDIASNTYAMVDHLGFLYAHHPAREFVVVVEDADIIPVLDYWVTVFHRTGERYAEAIDQGAWFDRPALPFHAVLETYSEAGLELINRTIWRETGERQPVPQLGASPFVADGPGESVRPLPDET